MDFKEELIGYPNNFFKERINSRIRKFISTNDIIEEKALVNFLEDTLFEVSVPLSTFTLNLGYMMNSDLIERMMRFEHNYVKDPSSGKTIYRKIYK